MDFFNKKVLLLIHQGDLGGAERQGLGLSKILTEKYDCEVNVLLTFSGEITAEFEEFAKESRVNKILFFEQPYLYCKREMSLRNVKRFIWSTKYLLRLRKELLPFEPEILIPFLNYPSKLSFYLSKLLPSVKVTFWHQLGLDSNSLDIFESIAVKHIPFVIANATNGLEMFRGIYKVNEEKLNVLPQYVSLNVEKNSEQKKQTRNALSIPEEAVVIGMVAHYRPEKLQELLLRSFISLTEKHKNVYLIFLGNKDQTPVSQKKYEALVKIVHEHDLGSKIKILSGVAVEKILNIIDIGVLVSVVEGVPNVVMEYMAYGLPVVTTAHPGCVGLLQNSNFLIQNDEEALCQAIDYLIVSRERREEEGQANLKLVSSYTAASYVEKLESIINKYTKY